MPRIFMRGEVYSCKSWSCSPFRPLCASLNFPPTPPPFQEESLVPFRNHCLPAPTLIHRRGVFRAPFLSIGRRDHVHQRERAAAIFAPEFADAVEAFPTAPSFS